MSKQKKKTAALHVLWIIPLVLILVFAALMYVIPAFETVGSKTAEGSKDWMKDLPDELPLSEVVLPGTHDSATHYVALAFFSKCQALSIREQLDAGYRYLDIRLGDGEGMPLMHGFTGCAVSGWPWAGKLLLDKVLGDCAAFLEENPTETVVFCVKHEHGDATDAAFSDSLAAYAAKYPGLWYGGDTIPTVGEARGKIVLLKRFDDPGNKLPGIAFDWEDQGGSSDVSLNAAANENPACTVFVQDRYEYDAEEKWAAFTAGMEAGETSGSSVTLSFLSTKGHAKYGHPYGFAPGLNKKLVSSSKDALRGWIIVDFGSADIAEFIYGANFD